MSIVEDAALLNIHSEQKVRHSKHSQKKIPTMSYRMLNSFALELCLGCCLASHAGPFRRRKQEYGTASRELHATRAAL
jgi:hypothetical protein